jgi:hypothetical protein
VSHHCESKRNQSPKGYPATYRIPECIHLTSP